MAETSQAGANAVSAAAEALDEVRHQQLFSTQLISEPQEKQPSYLWLHVRQ
jgi:hypothetical protein